MLREIYKLKNSNCKYKEMYKSKSNELHMVRAECNAHKNRADEMKQLILTRLQSLELRVTQNNSFDTINECESIL